MRVLASFHFLFKLCLPIQTVALVPKSDNILLHPWQSEHTN